MISPEQVEVPGRSIVQAGTPVFDEVMHVARIAWRFQNNTTNNPYVEQRPIEQRPIDRRQPRHESGMFRTTTSSVFYEPQRLAERRVIEAWQLAGIALELGVEKLHDRIGPAYDNASYHEMITTDKS